MYSILHIFLHSNAGVDRGKSNRYIFYFFYKPVFWHCFVRKVAVVGVHLDSNRGSWAPLAKVMANRMGSVLY